MKTGFRVINSGVFSLIQDFGRYGYQKYGISASGALDELAFFWSQKLLNNSPYCNTLEIYLGNVELIAEVNTNISITGAEGDFFINDKKLPLWTSYFIQKGDSVRIGKIYSGCRNYLSVEGGFLIPLEFGSNSTCLRENIGGINGKKIKNDDFLPCTVSEYQSQKILPLRNIPQYNNEYHIRFVENTHYKYFSMEAIHKFCSLQFEVASNSDRMGIRLQGTEKITAPSLPFISEGISLGSIQVPPAGEPIILLKDRQTIGGYPKIGSVICPDISFLAQILPTDRIFFKKIDYQDAESITKRYYNYLI